MPKYVVKASDAKAILTCRKLWENKPLNFPADNVISPDDITGSTSAFTPCADLIQKFPAIILYIFSTIGSPKGIFQRHEFLTHIIDMSSEIKDWSYLAVHFFSCNNINVRRAAERRNAVFCCRRKVS